MYILVSFDGRDLKQVDGAPFDLRYHSSSISDEELVSHLMNESNRILFLGRDLFKRVKELVHLPIRKEGYDDCVGIRVLTLASGCKVKFMDDWNTGLGSHIFRNDLIKDAVPSTPKTNRIIKTYREAEPILRSLIDLPYGTLFGFDYETSGFINKNPNQENFKYRQWQGRETSLDSYNGRTFQVTGASICTEEGDSSFFDFLSLINSDEGKLFLSLMDEFLTKHSFNCWVANANFETAVSQFVFNKFYIFNDVFVINYIDGRNKRRTSLKFVVQRVLRLRSWDDAFDELNDEIANLLTDSYQVNWDQGTVVQDGVEYVWYQSPRFTEIFQKYGDEAVAEAKRLAKDSFMNSLLCIPAEILGTYCNIDSYVTVELAKYIKANNTPECVEVFTSNMRFHVFLNAGGNFIDTQELKRQKLMANSASNWGMICLFQFVTDTEIKEFQYTHDIESLSNVAKGSEILSWCLNNNIGYTSNYTEMLHRILNHCYDYNSEWQVNINRLHEAFPWDYSYDAIYDQIVAWGGIDAAQKKKKFWSGNSWIVAEYGAYTEEVIKSLNELIYWKQLNRKAEWCKYLTRIFPSWDSSASTKYLTLQGAYSAAISNFKSSNGKPWYESDEIYNISYPNAIEITDVSLGLIEVTNLPNYSTEPVHHFIAGIINCGAPAGMEWMKNWFISYLDVWKDILLITFLGNDNEYILGYDFWDSVDLSTPNIWASAEGKKITPMKLLYDVDGNITECFPVLDEFGFTEIGEVINSPFGKITKAVNARDKETGLGLNREQFIEKCGFDIPLIEMEWEGYIGTRYMYTETLTTEILMPLVDSWWKRGVRGYKDFMEVIVTHIGKYEMFTIGTRPWDWDEINSTKVDLSNKLHQMKIILGLYTWRKFRKVLGTYLNSLLVEGARYSETYDKNSNPLFSEYELGEWKEGWDIMRGHPNWNCMGVHTKRWSSGFHTLFGKSDTKKIITVPKNCLFFYLDISQAEPRTLAYRSGDPLMRSWYEEGKDIYIELAKLFNPQIVNATHLSEDEKKARLVEERGLFKILVLAIMYGMGITSLSSMTGKPKKVAQKYKDEFFDAMPKLKEFIEGRMNYPNWDNGPSVWTILGDYLELYPWDEYRWSRQGINFCIQSFSALVLINGFENLVRTAIADNLIFSPVGTVHDSSQMIMDARFIYNCQAHFDVNYTGYLYKTHGIKYKGDIKVGVNYYELSDLFILDDTTIKLVGSATSILDILRNLRNSGIEDYELNVPIESLVPDMYSSIPKQVARTMGAGTISDKSKYKVEVKFKENVLGFHRSLVEGEAVKVQVEEEFIEDNEMDSEDE